jgi:hypothetical protein
MEVRAGFLRVLNAEPKIQSPDVSLIATANFGFPLSAESSDVTINRGQYQLGATLAGAIHYNVLRMTTFHAPPFNLVRLTAGAGLSPFYSFGHGEAGQGGIAPEIFGDIALINVFGLHFAFKGLHRGFFGTPSFGVGARLAFPL